ncbi:FadR/GntR family transcriptional regulator [Galbitalea soli]|uniref:FadR family transcriptional regulator n=1 Tax=Galbitalea soli TaxID=1268042 RepID=A0A7C9PMN3_9MICO|nr:FadR/GntR family transcriptional regulator [Galbitalea soli]NEM91032.1 FadR family transcriptional regulator [Galbitalea soli]NYJ29720.1 DNA-binding FadR family transcriptional regulator [Galbitalea soli]
MSEVRTDLGLPVTTFLGSTPPRAPAARLGVAVVHDLVSAIVTGEVQPGQSLPPEGVLSQQFGVSRTVIRESVKRIEEKGLVKIAQGRGTEVLPTSSWNVLDPIVLSALVENDDSVGVLDELAVVRGSLEGSMAAEAATARSDDELATLRESFAHMDETKGDKRFEQADVDFHLIVMEASRNRLAQSITKILYERARESTRFTGAVTDEAIQLTLDEHARILRAIERGDAIAAENAMREHIRVAWQRRRLPTHRRS